MANTFSQIYMQLVFAVKQRDALIQLEWEQRLYQYITGIIRNQGQKPLAINGMPDHIHILVGLKPTCYLPDFVKDIKTSSNDFVKENKLSRKKFDWQTGYGAFSYGQSQYKQVANYISNQKIHHKKASFKEEYLLFLQKFEISYEDEYLFDWFE